MPATLLEAAEREKDIRFSSRTRMNTDKNRQIHNARMAVRDLIGKLPDYLQERSVGRILREAAKENTVTVVHLIYRSKNHESSPRITTSPMSAWSSTGTPGVRDVHLSMRHKDWLERPQSGETMVTYDLTRDSEAPPPKRSEENGYVDRQDRGGDRLDQRHRARDARAFAGAGANVVINGMGVPADIEKRALRHRNRFQGQGGAIRRPT